ncbi:MAG: hypothetical protein ABSD42_12090 [Candidatus Bathyarchaeia archaeon]
MGTNYQLLMEQYLADQRLMEQYRATQEYQRKTLELFWQEPSVIIAIAGAVVVAAYSYISNSMTSTNILYQVLRTFLIIFGALMSWTSAETAIKHRFYRMVLLDEIERMESEMRLKQIHVIKGKVKSPRQNGKIYIWEKISAEKMLIASLLFITIGFAVLGAYNAYLLILRLI